MSNELSVTALAGLASKPEIVALRDRGTKLLESVFRVPQRFETDDEHGRGIELLRRLGATVRDLEVQRKNSVGPINAVVKAVNNWFKTDGNVTELQEAQAYLKPICTEYANRKEQERQEAARIEQRRIQEQALLEAQRIEEEKKAAEAEARRKMQEARAKEDAARIERQKAKTEQDRILAREKEERARIEDAKAKQDLERAQAIDSEAVLNVAEKIEPSTKAAITRTEYGSTGSLRKTWVFEVDDISKVPAEFLVLNSKAVRVAVREGARSIPGLRIFEKSEIVVR